MTVSEEVVMIWHAMTINLNISDITFHMPKL